MNVVKKLFHKCNYFRWEIGFGHTIYGLGRYDYKVCKDCGKASEDKENFVLEKEVYKT